MSDAERLVRVGRALIKDGVWNDALGKLSRHEATQFNALRKTLILLEEMSDKRAIKPVTIEAIALPRAPTKKIDKSVLTISEPKRHRSKEHLRFVAGQPCLICGRSPSHAHHVRYAQSRGLSLKVSDEFTVPLCAIHHSENHATGDERRWWRRKIDPLPVAHRLWRESGAAGRAPNMTGSAIGDGARQSG